MFINFIFLYVNEAKQYILEKQRETWSTLWLITLENEIQNSCVWGQSQKISYQFHKGHHKKNSLYLYLIWTFSKTL